MLITCKLPDTLAARLEAVARAEHRSKSAVLREALEARLNKTSDEKTVYAIDLVRHLRGALKGGPSDLSTNPEHMRGFGE